MFPLGSCVWTVGPRLLTLLGEVVRPLRCGSRAHRRKWVTGGGPYWLQSCSNSNTKPSLLSVRFLDVIHEPRTNVPASKPVAMPTLPWNLELKEIFPYIAFDMHIVIMIRKVLNLLGCFYVLAAVKGAITNIKIPIHLCICTHTYRFPHKEEGLRYQHHFEVW